MIVSSDSGVGHLLKEHILTSKTSRAFKDYALPVAGLKKQMSGTWTPAVIERLSDVARAIDDAEVLRTELKLEANWDTQTERFVNCLRSLRSK